MICSPYAQKINCYLKEVFDLIDTNLQKGLSSPKVYPKESDDFLKHISEVFSRREAERMLKAPLLHQCSVIWDHAALRDIPTIWCLRVNSTVDAVYELVCASANVPSHCICNAFLSEMDLPRITNVLTKLGKTPLWICANPDSGQFLEIVESLADENSPFLVVCDWQQDDGEQTAMNRLARENSNLTFVCLP